MSLSLTVLTTIAGVLAPTATPTVDDARAELHDGSLAVEVTTSAPVAPEDVRTKSHPRAFVVYLDGARVRPDRTHLGDSDQPVTAYFRSTYAKVEVPLPAGLGCAGPAVVATGPDRVRVTVPCNGLPTSVAADRSAQSVAAQSVAAQPAAAQSVAAQPAAARPAATKPSAAELAGRPPAVGGTPRLAPPAAAAPSSVGSTAFEAPRAAASIGPEHLAAGAPRRGTWMAGALLIAAATAFLLWKRRRAPLYRQIQILETASLGPKRSLILARIGGVTMVIGASEAGLALLSTPAGAPAESTADSAGRSTTGELEPAPEAPTSMNGLVEHPGDLRQLFRPGAGDPSTAMSTVSGNPEEDAAFAAMLAETIEDQDLRQRLSAGFAGKIS